jgi:HEAT repeat protein
LREAVAQLQGADAAAVEQALAKLRELEGREAAEAVMARVQKGLPPQLAELAVETLGALQQPITTPVLVELTLHRRRQIREKAVAALGTLRVRSAVSVLLYALDDPSPEVRSAAARSLGLVGDARALKALTAAVEHGVDGALLAVAQLGTAKHVALILKHAKADVKASEPALHTLLSRTNLHQTSKLQVVEAIRSLATPEAEAVLNQWRSSFGKGTDPRLLEALAVQGAKP